MAEKPFCEPNPLTINHKINMKETIHFGNHVPGHGEGQRLAGNIEKRMVKYNRLRRHITLV